MSRFAGGLEISEKLTAVEHFLDGIGAEQLEVDEVQFFGVFAFVAFGPFSCVADGAYAFELTPGTRTLSSSCSMRYEKGKSEVSELR